MTLGVRQCSAPPAGPSAHSAASGIRPPGTETWSRGVTLNTSLEPPAGLLWSRRRPGDGPADEACHRKACPPGDHRRSTVTPTGSNYQNISAHPSPLPARPHVLHPSTYAPQHVKSETKRVLCRPRNKTWLKPHLIPLHQ